MKFFTKFLPAVALTMALAPFAAQAQAATPLTYVHVAAHKAVSGPLPEAQHVADVAAAQGQVIVQSGATAQRYPVSHGG